MSGPGAPMAPSDLMKRVSAFLPMMQAANEDLVNKSVVVETIDAKLTKDCKGDDDEDEFDGNEQTIQLKLDLGKVEDNPLIDLLSNDADNDNEGACQKQLPEKEETEPQKAISKLLASSLEKSTASKKSKLLIEEM